jgi:hypothetical protein
MNPDLAKIEKDPKGLKAALTAYFGGGVASGLNSQMGSMSMGGGAS